MKADPFAQLKLLDVQALDARVDQLRHQRSSLPELAEIAELETKHRTMTDQRRDQQIIVDDLTSAQKKADADVEQVKTRRKRDLDRIEQGLIGSPKDLEKMQHELESLERRISTLEDEELEVMEQLEEAQTALDGLVAELAAAEGRLTELGAVRDEKAKSIDEQSAAASAERASEVEEVPADLLALYDKLRVNKNGIGAAELRARQCGGCMLSVDNAELSRIRSLGSNEVVRCEECQRILIRTSESGL